MIIKQLSVFLENKAGRMLEVTELLGQADINLAALSLADTAEYGILRLVLSDPDRALNLLKEHGFSVRLTEVICLCTDNKPGELARALKSLGVAGVSIEYMYAFSRGAQSFVILKADEPVVAARALDGTGLKLMNAQEVYTLMSSCSD